MSIIASPIDQITSSVGMLKPITWADVLEDDEDEEVQGGGLEVSRLRLTSYSNAH